MKAIDRLLQYLEYKNIRPTRFEKELGLSNGYLGTQKRRNADLGEGVIVKVVDYCRDISVEWLLTGCGSMLRDTSVLEEPVEKRSYTDDSPKDDAMTVTQLLEIVNKQVDIIKEQNREINRLRNSISLVNSGIGIVGGGNLQNPPTPMPSQCGSAVENPSLEVQNPAQISVEKCSRK